MNNFRKMLILLFCSFSFLVNGKEASMDNGDSCLDAVHKIDSEKTRNTKKIDQRELFNMIRKGVVSIKVRAHIIMERSYNDKMWTGTGFIVDLEKGLIVTNSHVAGEMAVCTYEIKFGNGTKTDAKLEYIDPCYDIAVLSVDPKNIPQGSIALEMNDENIAVNSAVYSMGSSFGNEFSTYPGTIFDIYSILWLKVFPEQSMQFSGLTVPGASGSPVFGEDGKVVGLLYGGKFVSGAALPTKYIIPVINTLKQGKKFKRYFYGFMVDYMSLQDAVRVGIVPESAVAEYERDFPDSNNKILVVTKNLAAYKDGCDVLSGDVIISINGHKIGCHLQELDSIVQQSAEDDLEIEVYRSGKKQTVKAKTHLLSYADKMRLLSFAGATFFETNDDVRVLKGSTKRAVYITNSEPGSAFMEVTSPGTEGYGRGLFQITQIDGKSVSSIDDIVEILPDLMKKNSFVIKYIKSENDGEEVTVVTKYSPEFAESTLATFNEETKTWDVSNIENPSQSH